MALSHDALALQVGRQRQDQVGLPGRLGPGCGHAQQKVQAAEDRLQPVRLGQLRQRVVLIDDAGLEGIGLAGLHGMQGQRQQPRPALVGRSFPARPVGSLFVDRREEIHQPLQPRLTDVRRPRGERQAAPGANRTQQRIDEVGRTAHEKGIRVAGGHPARMPDHLRGGLGQGLGKRHDVRGLDTRFGLGKLRRAGAHQVAQFVQVLDPLSGIGFIVELAARAGCG